MVKIVILCDLHHPFEDKPAVKAAFEFCKKLQPNIIVTHEWHDFYSISRFNKDPMRRMQLQEELDGVNSYFGILRMYCPKSRIIYLDSNHNKRLKKYLWSKAPELSQLRSLGIENLLNLKEHNVEYHDYFQYKEFLFKHGDLIRKWSAYTSRGEFELEGMSGCSGHSHRLGQHYRTVRGGEYTWMECGCLCRMDQEYLEGKIPDWQHGVGLVLYEGTEFRAQPLPIIENKIMWG